MVSGHTQSIDSAPIKANASMDSVELKVPAEMLDDHLEKVRYMSTVDPDSRISVKPGKARKLNYHCKSRF